MTDSLASLLAPVSADLFLKRYWRREYLHVTCSEASRYDNFLRVEDIDLFLQSDQLPAALVNVTMNGTLQPVEGWSRFEKSVRGEVRLAVTERLFELYRVGATIILNRTHRAIPRISIACRQLTMELGMGVGANIYITPPGAQGFARHSDRHDVLILLISGAKTFLLYPDGEVATEVHLKAGHLLYIPEGLAHEARTATTSSVHVTLGVNPVFAYHLIEEIASAAKTDLRFQNAFPPNSAGPGMSEAFEEEFRRDLLDFISEASVVSLAELRFRKVLDAQGNAWAGGQLTDLLNTPETSLDTVCILRSGAAPAFQEDGGDLHIRSGIALVSIPRFLRMACEDLLDGAPHKVQEVGGLITDQGKIHLVKSLVEAGIMRIVKN